MAKSSNLAYDAIRKGILDGRYLPRAHLREAAIAADIGVSRTPVREALRRLAADGYVTMVANQGAFVNPQSDESLSELIKVRRLPSTLNSTDSSSIIAATVGSTAYCDRRRTSPTSSAHIIPLAQTIGLAR